MSQEIIKEIKHKFMAFRNGVVADTLRSAGMPYHVIFGLQLPQIGEIARSLSSDTSLAKALWNDENVRESRLLASYIFPKDEVDEELAFELANSVRTVEEADIISFRLLRYLPFAQQLVARLADSGNSFAVYCSKALLRNLEALK